MNLNFYPSAPSLATRELLFAGFEESFDANIRDFPYHDKSYYFEIINRTDDALEWLESRVSDLETYQIPYAVFCNLKWLKINGLELIKRVNAHPDLCFVPLIAFAEPGEKMEREALLQHGLDDCYTVPVEWKRLASRLDFLNQYKSRLLELAGQLARENFRYQIPPVKRIFDVVGATLGILVSSVIWLPVAVAIVLESKGPVFYQSKRVGADYRVFDFLKFRSMYRDADRQVAELQHLNVYSIAGSDAVFIKFAHDPRITRVGRFIRKYSIDELPQLINVLLGDMSLVGPRPDVPAQRSLYSDADWAMRCSVRPGITGLAQALYRSTSTEAQRLEADLRYAREHTLWLDARIVWWTLGRLGGQGAN